jgi:hypothetical protein
MCNEYSGYTNYQTWNVNLWIDNDQGLYSYWNERAAEVWNDASPAYEWQSKKDAATSALEDELKDYFSELADEAIGNAGMFSDLLGHAIDSVNWGEIAHGLIETAAEDNPEDSEDEPTGEDPDGTIDLGLLPWQK